MTNQEALQEVPEEINRWIEQFVTDNGSPWGTMNAGIRTGARAMYRRDQVNIHNLMLEAGRQASLKESCFRTIDDMKKSMDKLESELAAARALIDEKNAWIESHA
jgi:hypothetical protein